MSVFEYIDNYITSLQIPLNAVAREKIEKWCAAMQADPLYSSVSKISDLREIALKHVLDSLIPTALVLALPCWKDAHAILDLGTGGGFPAVPLAITFNESLIYALDAKAKAVDFVRRMKTAAGINNLEPLLGRAEEVGRNKAFREKMDLVVSRAVASVNVLLELCLPLVKVGGYVLLYKGPALSEELSAAESAIHLLGVKAQDMKVLTLAPPLLPFTRGFVLVRKSQRISSLYPRRNGVPAANPL